MCWFGALLKHLARKDRSFTGVERQFEVLRELECIGRASILTQSAIHAAAEVVGEVRQLLAARDRIALAADDDQLLGTSQSAEIAGDAQSLVCLGIDVETRSAAKALGNLRSLKRILLGVSLLWRLRAKSYAESLQKIQEREAVKQPGKLSCRLHRYHPTL